MKPLVHSSPRLQTRWRTPLFWPALSHSWAPVGMGNARCCAFSSFLEQQQNEIVIGSYNLEGVVQQKLASCLVPSPITRLLWSPHQVCSANCDMNSYRAFTTRVATSCYTLLEPIVIFSNQR